MNTVKQQITTLTYLGVLALSMILSSAGRSVAADGQTKASTTNTNDLAAKLIGTWKLESAVNPGSPSGIGTRLKLFTATHWCIVQPDPTTGVIVFQHGGRYVLEGKQMKETVEFAGELTKSAIGTTGTRIIEIESDTYKQVDPKGVFTETWKRVK